LTWQHLGAVLTGVAIGFLGGLLAREAARLPLRYSACWVFPVSLRFASPLPAAIPSTLVASAEYWRSHLLDWEIVWWSIGIGTPAIMAGSFLSPYVGAKPLLVVTGLLVLAFGVSFLFFPKDRSLATEAKDNPEGLRPAYWRVRLVAVAVGVGLISGLLANAGGFLLVPCYTVLLRQP